jgi:hypothetical protein
MVVSFEYTELHLHLREIHCTCCKSSSRVSWWSFQQLRSGPIQKCMEQAVQWNVRVRCLQPLNSHICRLAARVGQCPPSARRCGDSALARFF